MCTSKPFFIFIYWIFCCFQFKIILIIFIFIVRIKCFFIISFFTKRLNFLLLNRTSTKFLWSSLYLPCFITSLQCAITKFFINLTSFNRMFRTKNRFFHTPLRCINSQLTVHLIPLLDHTQINSTSYMDSKCTIFVITLYTSTFFNFAMETSQIKSGFRNTATYS